eukprot:Ihof_evm2s225 gene=Ihof_evmTU2s225
MVAQDVRDIAKRAREASWKVQSIDTEKKNKALAVIKAKLSERREDILNANKKDLEEAAVQVAKGKLSSTLVKRLDLAGKDFGKFNDLLTGLDDVAALEDPVGKVTLARRLDEGLDMYRVACPVGVICIIFEARPECCVQISSLCLKSGNAVILKGGKEAHHSNQALVKVLQEALATAGIPEGMVQLVETREEVAELLSMDEYIDLVIPRGSNALVKYVKNNTRIPVLGHADGLCSIFLDQSADVAKAVSVVVDAKTNYPAACNSTETLLVHSSVLSTVLPLVGAGLAAAGVQMKADERCLSHLPSANTMAAIPDDFHTEFLDLTIAVKAVDSLEEAVNHVNTHGSHHTDCIVTEDKANAEWFMSRIDSAGVYHNASTRFADGFRYGFGAEIGVSTNKTHARGPVGLEGLLIYKYRMYGNGQ